MNRAYRDTVSNKRLWHLLSVFVVGVSVAVAASSTEAQSPPPRVVLETHGPVGQIRQLRFSGDSQRLYAAGLDKRVHVYEVGWENRGGGPPALTRVPPMDWEQARGNRGGIFALALHPNAPEMILGGVGARQQTGDIATFDLATGRVSGCVPTPAERTTAAKAQRIGTEGHRYSVMSLDYSLDGMRFVSRDERGGMFLWNRQQGGGFQGTRLRPAGPEAIRFAPRAIFSDNQTLVYSRRENDARVRLIARSIRTGNEATFTEDYYERVAALTRDHRGLFWASADARGSVYVSDIQNPSNRFRVRAQLPHVTSVSIGPTSFAVLSNQFIDGRAGNSIVELFDLTTKKRLDSFVVSTTENSLAVAISPNGRFLAVSKEDPREIVLFSLADRRSNPISNPFNATPAVARADVLSTRVLALSEDGTRLGFGPDERSIASALELAHGEIATDQNTRDDWVFAQNNPPGWQVVRVDLPTTQIKVVDPRGKSWLIRLNQSFQGTYSTHCFLFADDGITPVGIAIGTENVNSIFVYGLTGNTLANSVDLAPPMLRWYRDHTGTITSLVPSKDAKTLFSSAADDTIKLWRLSGLFDDDRSGAGVGKFERSAFWGCEFTVEGGDVIVRNIDPEGIAFARSLRDGDRITRIQGYDERNLNAILDAQAGTQTAGEILATLNRVSVLRQNLIHAQSAGPNGEVETKRFIIRPSWEPFLTAFANESGEWAIWHPSGFFNASAAEGGSLFEWMILRGADRPPRLVEAGFLSKEFERPETIRKLLSGVSIVDAVAGAFLPDGYLAAAIESVPEVTILTPEIGRSLSADNVSTVTAMVDYGNADPDAYEVRASLDAARLSEPNVEVLAGNQYRYSWQVTASGRMNQIGVVVKERGGALVSYYASDVAYRRGDADAKSPYQLHVLSLASEDYSGPIANQRNGFGRLEYPIDDVDAVVSSLREKQLAGLGQYQLGHVRELRDDEITPESVGREINLLNGKLRGEEIRQILIVYLSGHGTTIDGEYHYVTTTSRSADEDELRRSSLPWSLLDRAGGPDAEVIYMIDTCHSGSAVDAKSSIRDPLRSGGVVIAAASGRESAKELAPLEHGCFTYSVLAALDGDADGAGAATSGTEANGGARSGGEDRSESSNADGVVSLSELISFVRDFVGQLTAGEQKPTIAPLRLSKTLQLDLVRTAP